jgi:hypothetical protein
VGFQSTKTLQIQVHLPKMAKSGKWLEENLAVAHYVMSPTLIKNLQESKKFINIIRGDLVILEDPNESRYHKSKSVPKPKVDIVS